MIHLDKVSKSYRTRTGWTKVLDAASLKVERGEKVGILGRNGAGKSTMIRLLSGSEKPDKGDVQQTMTVSWPLAFSGAFQGSLTGIDNLKFVCRIYGVDYRQHLTWIEDFTELGIYLHEPVRNYSSGMQARLAFALSMAVEFDCFLIDEVVAVGDSRFRAKCEFELFQKRSDRAKILVSHDPGFLNAHCDRLVLLSQGQLTQFTSKDDAFLAYEADLNSGAIS